MAGKSKSKSKTPQKAGTKRVYDPEHIAECVDFRVQGFTPQQIATNFDPKFKYTAVDVVEMIEIGLSDDYEEPPNFHVRLEIKRLQTLQQGIMEKAAAGDDAAIRLVQSLEEKIAARKLALVPDLREIYGDGSLMRRKGFTSLADLSKPGRPPHKPTIATMKLVEGLARTQTPLTVIARMVPCGINQLKEYYGDIIETARHSMVAMAGGTLVGAMEKGDVRAATEVLDRFGPENLRRPTGGTSHLGGGAEKSKVDPASQAVANGSGPVEIIGGLPLGSTPENPGGEHDSDIPPESV